MHTVHIAIVEEGWGDIQHGLPGGYPLEQAHWRKNLTTLGTRLKLGLAHHAIHDVGRIQLSIGGWVDSILIGATLIASQVPWQCS